MSAYKKFRVEAHNDHTIFRVQVKGWFGIWKSGYVYTDYFGIGYDSQDDALQAIKKYKSRFTNA